MKNKRGIEAEVLIGIIITVIVAAVIFLFLRGLTWMSIIDREACHQSVVMRSMPSVIGDAMKKAIPIKCKTEKILINFDNEEFIKQRIANAMYDCWWMLGEGKLDFFTESSFKFLTGVENTRTGCVICSTIKFDERTKKKFRLTDINDYVQDTKIPLKDVTYLDYFASQKGTKLETDARISPIDTSKTYAIVYMGIKGAGFWDPFLQDAKNVGTITGGAFLVGGFGAVRSLGSLVGMVGAKAIAVAMAAVLVAQEMVVAKSAIAAIIHCDQGLFNAPGCNILILTEYNQEQLKENCGNIESIP